VDLATVKVSLQSQHGFIRTPGGTLTTIDGPNPPIPPITVALAINPAGEITGNYFDANGIFHGFLLAPDGTFNTIDFPGAGNARAFSINTAGEITGNYLDANSISHGFLRIP
jgi:hypothetical protein